jgi:hypothetical protein
MCTALLTAVLFVPTIMAHQSGPHEGHQRVDKTIEITRKDGKLVFTERGKDANKAVAIVVGQRIRWENKDSRTHALVCTLMVDGKPLFDTEVIKPGEHKDVLFDFDMYKRAHGKPANVVTLKYRSHEPSSKPGELQFLSAARR